MSSSPIVLNYNITFPSSFTEEDKKNLNTKKDIIVLIHGLTSAYQTFLNILEPLANQSGFPVIGIDLRGHGGSDEAPLTEAEKKKYPDAQNGADYTIKSMAADVAETLFVNKTHEKALKFSSSADNKFVHILGHSWGSRVALAFAENYPTVVKSVIVEDEYIRAEDVNAKDNRKGPAISDEENTDRCFKMMQQWNAVDKKFKSEEECEKFYESICGPASKMGLDNYSRKIGCSKDGSVYFPLMKGHVTATFDEYARKADMNAVWKNEGGKFSGFPIHIICGDGTENGADVSHDDYAILKKEAEVMVAQSGLRRSIEMIDGCGHVVHRTHFDQFMKSLLEFITKAVSG